MLTTLSQTKKNARLNVSTAPQKKRHIKQVMPSEDIMKITPEEEDVAFIRCHIVLEEDAWNALWEVLEAPSRDLSGLKKLLLEKTVLDEDF